MFTKWSYKLLTGNEMIDRQHKEIFDRADQMINLGRSGKTIAEATKIIEYLEGYYERHFRAEEALQEKYTYPGIEAHRQMHTEFRDKLAELKHKFTISGANYALAVETVMFMLEWLAEHIDKEDKAFAAYIRSNQSTKLSTVGGSPTS